MFCVLKLPTPFRKVIYAFSRTLNDDYTKTLCTVNIPVSVQWITIHGYAWNDFLTAR